MKRILGPRKVVTPSTALCSDNELNYSKITVKMHACRSLVRQLRLVRIEMTNQLDDDYDYSVDNLSD